jgi:hypothetical protein
MMAELDEGAFPAQPHVDRLNFHILKNVPPVTHFSQVPPMLKAIAGFSIGPSLLGRFHNTASSEPPAIKAMKTPTTCQYRWFPGPRCSQ